MTTFSEALEDARKVAARNGDDHLLQALKKIIEPTDRQREVLAQIDSCQRTNGYAPTVRELCDLMSIASTQGIECHLAALKRKGLLTSKRMKSRTLEITKDGRAWLPKEAA